MKRIILILVAVFAVQLSQAQTFEQGSKNLHIGIGFGSPYAYSGAKMGVPPVHASLEIGVTDNIGVGGLIGYSTAVYESSTFIGDYKWKYSYLIIGARGAYHFTNIEACDLYAGAMLGYNVVGAKFETDIDGFDESLVSAGSASGVAFGGFLGARKDLGENFTIFGELGYSIAWISAGVCFNF